MALENRTEILSVLDHVIERRQMGDGGYQVKLELDRLPEKIVSAKFQAELGENKQPGGKLILLDEDGQAYQVDSDEVAQTTIDAKEMSDGKSLSALEKNQKTAFLLDLIKFNKDGNSITVDVAGLRKHKVKDVLFKSYATEKSIIYTLDMMLADNLLVVITSTGYIRVYHRLEPAPWSPIVEDIYSPNHDKWEFDIPSLVYQV